MLIFDPCADIAWEQASFRQQLIRCLVYFDNLTVLQQLFLYISAELNTASCQPPEIFRVYDSKLPQFPSFCAKSGITGYSGLILHSVTISVMSRMARLLPMHFFTT